MTQPTSITSGWHLPLNTRVRTPLSSNTNAPPAPPPSPSEPPALQTRQLIRRKASLSYGKKDSSEEIPSSNGSGIYNAHSYSKSSSVDSASKPENNAASDQATVGDHSNWESWEPRELDRDDLIGITPIIYGRGTRLDPITEKNSNSTMQSLSHRKSTGGLSSTTLSSFPSLNPQDSLDLSRLRRQRSRSLDISTQRSYHEACLSLVTAEPKSSEIHTQEIIAQPREPLVAPPKRSSTPPGVPSWDQKQKRSIPARTSSRDRVRDFLTGQSRLPLRSLTAAEIGHRRSLSSVPRYRPIRSGYGSIDNHPYNRLPAAKSEEPDRPRPKSLGGITVTKTFGTEILPQPPQPPPTVVPRRVNTVRFAPEVDRGRGIARTSSSRNPRPQPKSSGSRKPRPKSEWDIFGSRLEEEFFGVPFRANHTSVTAAPASGHHHHRSIGNFLKRQSSVSENGSNSTNHASEPVRSKVRTNKDLAPPSAPRAQASAAPLSPAITNPSIQTAGQSSAIGSPLSPTISQVNLVPVTNLEKTKRHKQDKKFCCMKCSTRRCLSKIGKWIDKTGERMENGVDLASKSCCLFCCGFTEAENDGESYRSGIRGGDLRESSKPRWVKLRDLPAAN